VGQGTAVLALGSDTGGSIRQPASFCGVVGVTPTYGRVSRYGLVAFASSLDHIGPFARSVHDAARLLQVIAGRDEMDSTSAFAPVPDFCTSLDGRVDGLRLGLPREYFKDLSSETGDRLTAAVQVLQKLGCQVFDISLPSTDYAIATYYIICTAEASANLARYDGVRYGHRAKGADTPEDMTIASRSEGFGAEVKLRILLGTYVLRSGFQDEYYLRAQKIRTAIRNDFEKAFRGVDLVLMPVYPVPPFVRGSVEADPFTQKLADVFTCAANLAGLPAMSFPAGVENGLPIGMQFLAPPLGEDQLFSVCRELERGQPSPDAPGFPAEWR
jgi:aspartyl-tRNA(Asn)/glutamyl-tRNA(Gln) amidotransferase subunit A